MFNIGDTVRVVDKERRTLVKEGLIVDLTTSGARVYQPKCEYPFTDSITFAEWFPFDSAKIMMVPSRSKRRKV